MKKMRLLIAVAALVCGLIQTSDAQVGRFSAGLELALPMGDFGDVAGTGFGGSLRYEYPLGDNIGLMATVGYLTFGEEDLGDFGTYTYSMIPIQVGGKYYFTEQQNGFYAMAELGVHSTTVDVEIPETNFFGIIIPGQSASESSTDLSFAPGVGYHLANLDFGLKYQIISTEGSSTSYLGIRAAYVFGSAD
jgi:hypothetical protein